MGCSTSTSKPRFSRTMVRTSSAFVIWTITPPEQKTIRRTWRKLSVDIVAQGERVMGRIFDLKPGTRHPFSKMHDDDETRQERSIKAHGSRLMQAIGATVDHIDDLDTSMAPLLVDLGKRHSTFEGFDVENFNTFAEAVVEVWGDQLKDKFKPEVEKAWRLVLDFMATKLKQGYREASRANSNVDVCRVHDKADDNGHFIK